MMTILRMAVVGTAAALALSACGDSADSGKDLSVSTSSEPTKTASTTPVKKVPRNPVKIAKTIPGCDVGDAKSGETDIDGNRYVTCIVNEQELSVTTTLGDPEDSIEVAPSDDSTATILGDDFVIYMWRGATTPQAVAKAVGGTVLGTADENGVATPAPASVPEQSVAPPVAPSLTPDAPPVTPSPTTPVVDCSDAANVPATGPFECTPESSAQIGANNEVLPKDQAGWDQFCSPSSGVSQANRDTYCNVGEDYYNPNNSTPTESQNVQTPAPGLAPCTDESLSQAEWMEQCWDASE